MAKHLSRLGWDVTVVTPDPSVWRNVDDPDRVSKELDREGIRRILTEHRWRWLEPVCLKCWNQGMGWIMGGTCRRIARRFGIDDGTGWITEAERACKVLAPGQIDVILASGPPFASFMVAKRLSVRLRCPYVLDYRDPWTSYPYSEQYAARGVRRKEEHLLAGCAAVTGVCPSLFNGTFGVDEKFHVITNGYDPDEMASVQPLAFGHFAIVYTGIFYPPQRVITPVMEALAALKATGIDRTIPWRFHYYGHQSGHVQAEAERFHVIDKVEVHGQVSRAEALSAISGAGVTIIITSVLEETAKEDKWIVTSKLFDALGLQVPILLIGPSGSDVHGIIEISGLARLLPACNIAGMVSFLTEAMMGKAPKARCPETYTWLNLVQRLDCVLRHATTTHSLPKNRWASPMTPTNYDSR